MGRNRSPDYEKTEIARLDALSRQRALSEVESILLERCINIVDKRHRQRARYGDNKVLARSGFERRVL